MENNSLKIRLGNLIYILIIIILIIALAVVYYLGFDKEAESNQEGENNIENNIATIVPTSDLVTLYYEANNERANIFYAYIENGYLYYFNDYAEANGISEGAFDYFSSFITSSTNNENMVKYEGLNNIKRMKTYNVGTGVNPIPFLITEDGKVYTVNFQSMDDIKVEKYEGLSNYKIEDILIYSGEKYSSFEILLKDGTTKTISMGSE